MQRPTVVLPEPLSPTRPSVSPWPIAKRHAVHRLHHGARAGDRKELGEVAHLEDGAHGRATGK